MTTSIPIQYIDFTPTDADIDMDGLYNLITNLDRHTYKISSNFFRCYILSIEDEDTIDIDDYFNSNLRLCLSIIKRYDPIVYDTFVITYDYDDDEYDEELTLEEKQLALNHSINYQLLWECGYVLERMFQSRYMVFLNELEGDDLSDAETDEGSDNEGSD